MRVEPFFLDLGVPRKPRRIQAAQDGICRSNFAERAVARADAGSNRVRQRPPVRRRATGGQEPTTESSGGRK